MHFLGCQDLCIPTPPVGRWLSARANSNQGTQFEHTRGTVKSVSFEAQQSVKSGGRGVNEID